MTEDRIESFARRLWAMEVELDELRRLVTPPAPQLDAPPPPPPPPPIFKAAEEPPAPPPRPPRRRPRLPQLTGPRALALAGGVVTLLGIAFFFVLAVDRGWIGPEGRVGLGALASALVFGAGLLARRRQGDTHASFAAAGAGIGGGFATLLAAGVLYDLVSAPAALLVAAGIAAVAVVTSIAWRSQVIAALGLVGAALVPAAVIPQHGISALGVAFATLILAATVLIALRQRWRALLAAGFVAVAPQTAGLIATTYGHPTDIVALAALLVVLAATAGIASAIRMPSASIAWLSSLLVSGSGLLSIWTAAELYTTDTQRGIALAVVAVAFGAVSALLYRRPELFAIGSLVIAVTFVLVAVVAADLLSGQSLAIVWAAEGAALAWLARRVADVRFLRWSTGYVALAALHVVAIDGRPLTLFSATTHPAAAVAAVFALAAAAAILARCAWGIVRDPAGWLAGLALVYGLSFVALGVVPSFQYGQVALAILWSVSGLGLTAAAARTGDRRLAAGSLAWFAGIVPIVVADAAVQMESTPRALALLALATAGFASGLVYQLRRGAPSADPFAFMGIGLGAALAAASGLSAFESSTLRGVAALGAATVFASTSAAVFARPGARELRTVLWGIAGGFVLAAGLLLTGGSLLVLWFAAAAVAFAALGTVLAEERFTYAGLAYFALAVLRVLAHQGAPAHLFVADSQSGVGAPAVAIVVAAGAAFVLLARNAALRKRLGWITGALAVYSVSLGLLAAVRWALPSHGLEADFHTGHTLVSAVWGMIGLTLLALGLKRTPALRLPGLGLLAVSLGKIFLFDLPSLTSLTRALSFLAVGAVLLVGGYLYQRSERQTSHSGEARRAPVG